MTTTSRTRLDIAKEITNKRAEQMAAVIPSTAAEIGEEIDRLLAEWVEAG